MIEETCQIQIMEVVKRYQYRPVLDHLSLTLAKGDFCVLVGANGAGKTTLLRILASLVRPDCGEILIGEPGAALIPETRKLIGYVGHETMFYQDLSAMENLQHYARLYRLPALEKAITDKINAVGLADYGDQPVRTYSRGMQQRLSIARVLIQNPAIYLLDEPYTGLDQEAAHWLDNQLQQLQQQRNTILLAAHRPQRLLPYATHITMLEDGQISLHLPVEALADHPRLHHYLQEAA